MAENNINPISVIKDEIEYSSETTDIGMLTVKNANKTISDAKKKPDPVPLFNDLWFEGELNCMFSDSNLGKSIFAVQIAESIAQHKKVLYVDCELSEKQFQMRYTDQITHESHIFPGTLLRAEINPANFDVLNYEDNVINNIELAAIKLIVSTIIIDNLTYLCNSSDKGVDAGVFMMKLLRLKKKYGWSMMIIAHTPKRNLSTPITQNDLAGSKKLYNLFDSVFAIGKSAKDPNRRYIKQLKVRNGEFKYGAENVMLYEIVKTHGFVHFEFIEFASEREHLRETSDSEYDILVEKVHELSQQGKSIREIGRQLGLSKSAVGRMVKKAMKCPTVPPTENAGQAGHLGHLGQRDSGTPNRARL